jgi:hypothetical protein
MADPAPPELLVDRSLGGIAVPAYLEQAWPSAVQTLDDVFGVRPVPDVEWMAYAEQHGMIAVCKDRMIRRRRGERELLSLGTLRVFCLANGNLTRTGMVRRFDQNLPAMLGQSLAPGPWLYALYADRIAALTLYGRRR